MMLIRLAPGEVLRVGTMDEHGRPNDGEFTICFDLNDDRKLTVAADTAGNVQGAEGIIYEENFGIYEEFLGASEHTSKQK